MDIYKKDKELRLEFKENYNFHTLLKHLNSNEFIYTIELILLGDLKFLNLFFPSLRNIDPDESALIALIDLPGYILERLSACSNIVFQRALNNYYGTKSKEVQKKLFTLSMNIEFGLTDSYIIDLVFNPNTSSDIKIELLYLLDERKQVKYVDKYISSYRLKDEPLMLPFIVDKMDKGNKEIIITLFKEFSSINIENPNNDISNWFYSVLYDIIQVANNTDDIQFVFDFLKILNFWLYETSISILQNEEFKSFYSKYLICVEGNKEEVPDWEIIDLNLEAIKSINFKYAGPEMADSVIEKVEAESLLSITGAMKFLAVKIEPFIREQLTINRRDINNDPYKDFIDEISDINSLEELSLALI
ncbi:MAG: hypothetical protein L3J66_12140 [Bacteroidales bacterium]|nr:hypothetical protein [Bacteroidales bacterium]